MHIHGWVQPSTLHNKQQKRRQAAQIIQAKMYFMKLRGQGSTLLSYLRGSENRFGKQLLAYLGRRGSGEGLDWASGGLPSPRSHHLQRRSRERKTGSELCGAGCIERRCGPAARPPPPLLSARCGSGGPLAGCSHTGPPRPSSWGPGGPLWLRRGTALPSSTFSASPWLD